MSFFREVQKKVLLGYVVWFVSLALPITYLILEPSMNSVRFIHEDIQYYFFNGWLVWCAFLTITRFIFFLDCWVLDIFLAPLAGWYLVLMWMYLPMMIYRLFP